MPRNRMQTASASRYFTDIILCLVRLNGTTQHTSIAVYEYVNIYICCSCIYSVICTLFPFRPLNAIIQIQNIFT